MSRIELKSLTKSFGGHGVIHGVDIQIPDGGFCIFVGPSGCGKSTLLRMIAGLEEVSSGQILLDDVPVNDLAPSDRGLAMVFQSYALYPHMTVAQNMSFGLRRTGHGKAETAARVAEAAAILQLQPLMNRKPAQLSGGQRQRVAIGRAIVRKPRAFLFDEPLSNLDAELRAQMRVELAELHARLGATMVYVTHDQVEAMTLASQIVVLRDGRVEQIGSPAEVYGNPANTFVAGFIGSPRMNLLAVAPGMGPEGATTLGLRPEALVLGEGDLTLTLRVEMVENLGGSSLVHGRLSDGQRLLLEARGDGRPRQGEVLTVTAPSAHRFWFDARGLRLSAQGARQ